MDAKSEAEENRDQRTPGEAVECKSQIYHQQMANLHKHKAQADEQTSSGNSTFYCIEERGITQPLISGPCMAKGGITASWFRYGPVSPCVRRIRGPKT
jgi:hypothetical protein